MRNMNMKKYIALILLITVLCMSFMPGAVFADTTGTADTKVEGTENTDTEEKKDTITGNGESAASAQKAKENNTVNTGLDPLWSFVNINAPEQVLVGQKFDVEVTVKNMGTGSGLFPVFRFTEEADKKALSHFTIIGGTEDGEYDTMLTEIPGGETKKPEIQTEAKELMIFIQGF